MPETLGVLFIAFIAATYYLFKNLFSRRPAAERAMLVLRNLGFMLLSVALGAAVIAPSHSNREVVASVSRVAIGAGIAALPLIIVCSIALLYFRLKRSS